jgi:hypothetical protein
VDRSKLGVVLALAGALALPTLGGATTLLQKKAVEAGFPAQDCLYCHTFDVNHMRERARTMGLPGSNCGGCHGSRLPKTGLALMNGRGRWLVTEKARRKAPVVDVLWLKEYVAPKPSPAHR